jgi:two-component system OmpR family response regulator
VWHRGTELSLTAREFSMLELFMRHPGEVLSRFELLEHVWDDSYENRSNVIEVYVGYLRDKLDREAIETVRGAGYRLRA